MTFLKIKEQHEKKGEKMVILLIIVLIQITFIFQLLNQYKLNNKAAKKNTKY